MKKRILFLTFLSLFFLTLSCERVKKTQEPPLVEPQTQTGLDTFKSEEPPSISVANVVLFPKNKDGVTLTVEIAKSAEEKRIGLQNRASLPDKHGMWFIFDNDSQDPFWMKDTPISLDILFVDKNYKIVDLVKNAEPNSETLLVSRAKYRYVLEIKAGSVDAYGLSVGDSAEFRLGPP